MEYPSVVLLASWLSLTRKYPEERENETHAQVWLEIAVRLTSPDIRKRRCHRCCPRFVLIVDVGAGGQVIAAWQGTGIWIRRGQDRVSVHWYLICRQSDAFDAAILGLDKSRSHMDRKPASQVRQGEGALAIAAVRGADQVEQSLVFGNRE